MPLDDGAKDNNDLIRMQHIGHRNHPHQFMADTHSQQLETSSHSLALHLVPATDLIPSILAADPRFDTQSPSLKLPLQI